MCYTIIGVPLLVIYLLITGRLLSKYFGRLYAKLACTSSAPTPRGEEEDAENIEISQEMLKGRSNNYNNTSTLSRRHGDAHLASDQTLWNPTYAMNGHLGWVDGSWIHFIIYFTWRLKKIFFWISFFRAFFHVKKTCQRLTYQKISLLHIHTPRARRYLHQKRDAKPRKSWRL